MLPPNPTSSTTVSSLLLGRDVRTLTWWHPPLLTHSDSSHSIHTHEQRDTRMCVCANSIRYVDSIFEIALLYSMCARITAARITVHEQHIHTRTAQHTYMFTRSARLSQLARLFVEFGPASLLDYACCHPSPRSSCAPTQHLACAQDG